jgi:hypothetical protein
MGCGCLALIVVAVAAVLGFVVWRASKGVENVTVTIAVPPEVRRGEDLDLVVSVRNDRPSDELRIGDVDLALDYLRGFTVAGTDPQPKTSMDMDLFGLRSFTFDTVVGPLETATFTFHLRAVQEGNFAGDVDVYEGSTRCVTQVAQTVVLPPSP